MTRIRRLVAIAVASSLTFAGTMQSAQAALIGTAQLVAAQTGAQSGAQSGAPAERSAAHEQLRAALQRADVASALQARGVDLDAARARVAALSDAEASYLADQIDHAPAGGDSLLGVLVFIFVLLLVTDILGLTKVFPFTRSVR